MPASIRTDFDTVLAVSAPVKEIAPVLEISTTPTDVPPVIIRPSESAM